MTSNLPAILSTLDQEITALSKQLAPVKPDFIAECLHKLKSGGMLVPKSIAAADFLTEYTIALGGVPEHGLKVVVVKLKRGEYPDVNPEFMPLPAQLAAMARAECRVLRDDIARLREKQSTIADLNKQPENTPEERRRQIARVRELHAGFKQANEAARDAQLGVVHEPMDAEQAAYWSQMQALPDRKQISAEQKAFRRKIGEEVAAAPVPEAAQNHADVEF